MAIVETMPDRRSQVERIELRVRGQLDPDWSEWMQGLTLTPTPQGETIARGTLRDQSAVCGLVYRLPGLNLSLVSLICQTLEAPDKKEAHIDKTDIEAGRNTGNSGIMASSQTQGGRR
jgi:hypothetical protein